MADLNTLMRMRPEYGTFLNRRNLIHRGEVVAFRPNARLKYFNTDGAGFRHSSFKGKLLSVKEALESEKYGLVLGSSHIFGLGIIGDEHTLPSLLAEEFGIPFANVSLPEGNSRNLFSLLNGYLARLPNPPAAVIHFSGGDFTSFCYGGTADPVFGSPNLMQIADASEQVANYPPAAATFPALQAFTTLWTRSIIQLCKARQVPVILGHDTTFFEKSGANEFEKTCKLGTPFNPLQQRWFPVHKEFFPKFLERREEIAARTGVPLAGPGPHNTLGFIDEFHYDEDGMRMLSQDVTKALQPILKTAK